MPGGLIRSGIFNRRAASAMSGVESSAKARDSNSASMPQDSAILLAKPSQNRIDESESGNRDRLVQLLLLLDRNLLKNQAVFCHVFAEVCFPSVNDFFHLRQFLFVGPDAAAFRTFV